MEANTNTRELPVGIQDFEKLRTENYIYVDKTQYVYQLTKSSRPYFLSRPRRFGKSLFLSTIKAYFEGKKELFEGLAIAEMEHEWTKYPVLHIDFNVGIITDVNALTKRLHEVLRKLEEEWNSPAKDEDLAARFETLIQNVCRQTGRKVAVLIDEYDRPLIGTMDNPQTNEEIRHVLKGFYGTLKSADAHLRFVFLTGVTKFSKVSIFSDLNQLQDISMNEDFAGICGITQTEMEENFRPEITALAKRNAQTYEEAIDRLRKCYNGYRFSEAEESVYNPFSLLNNFSERKYKYYWFATGTPTFLVKALQNQRYDIRKLENDTAVSSDSIMDYRAKDDDLLPLLYQTGYLTIKSYDSALDRYILGYPNEEVKYGFMKELLPVFVLKKISSGDFAIASFAEKLMKGEVEEFMTLLKAFYAAIPYDAIKKEHRDEQYYQHVFYLLFTLIGQLVQTEVKSAVGRADAVVKTADSIYVFEFKMDSNATAEQALKQIDDKGYLIPYVADNRRLVKIGVEFSQKERSVKRWRVL